MMSDKIKAARRRAGYSQQQIADHLGISRSAVTKWESHNPNQNNAPERRCLMEFARVARVPVGFFMDDTLGVADMPPPTGPLIGLKSATAKARTLAEAYRNFWDEVSARLPASLRTQVQIDFPVEAWERPIVPDIVSARSAVRLVRHSRPYPHLFATDLSALVAYERSRGACLRLAALFYLPDDVDLFESDDMRAQFDAADERTSMLADRLKVTYVRVSTVQEAIRYLEQIL